MEKQKIYTFKSKQLQKTPSNSNLQQPTSESFRPTSVTATATANSLNVNATPPGNNNYNYNNGGNINNKKSEDVFVNVDIDYNLKSPLALQKPSMAAKSLPEITLYDVLFDQSPSQTAGHTLPQTKSSSSLPDTKISMTRQRTLPPKNPKEERKHLKEHKKLMKKAIQREEEERKRWEKRSREREAIESKHLKIWQSEIIPRWPKSKDEEMTRDIWWFGIPPIVRGRVWQMVIRNDLRLTPSVYFSLLKRAADLMALQDPRLSSQNGEHTPMDVIKMEELQRLKRSLETIHLDADRTFPAFGLFQSESPLQTKLISVLQAFAMYRPDLGYVQGMSFHAAMLLVNMEEADAFIAMCNLFNKPFLTSFYLMDTQKMDRYYRVFQMFFAEFLPDLYLTFVRLNIDLHMFLLEWFLSLYSRSLPMDVAMRIWDCYFLFGEVFLIRCGLGLLKYLQEKLIGVGFEAAVSLLTHLPTDIDEDQLFECIEWIEISTEKYFNLLGSI